ncbi:MULTISPECIES: DUF4129 domain-containing protein [Cellulophaga]|uniref:Protein-glutamine gamma-glutamyltransferase-like C-terminal domain-containing protein n=1 Tax=Cellulophaga lytica (strain ATCC 23178 / DSM 7489 / JCM 8516 / NBRC 14961 / NCIMB 1423 / VKM B-1433 / Cy l20) TaxID=867900 RepID=F0RGL9_CELLC|nr:MULTISPECIES: DUF4129 domain-containing protein [Cellulophaga]ADY28044.1 hypothetical protein Celly_0209 [Cellulophaga lytica DSM 7489]AIM59122.1 hypothetical protein IX49_00715 [Cellulophaga lytica]APU08927.1 hypothetical protein A5M85_01065 [Cellulophaga lytica]TVZ09386.1 uncharacterized protein DUF4129 [Cellulophaga sp. RHA_52]WQG77767.1 DUF4129 domain-containing protein [Cellulophaga lytica]
MQKLLFSLLICITFSISAYSFQDSTNVEYDDASMPVQKITEEDLQSYKDDSSYNYTLEKADNSWWEKFKTWLYSYWLRFFQWLFGGEKAVGYLSAFLGLLPYLLLVILIVVAVLFFLKTNMNSISLSKKNKSAVTLSEEENIIKNEDIQQLIKNALEDKNYRLAIRYYYLYILKIMSEKDLIDWQLQKTNDDYQKELSNSTYAKPFVTITRLYDYIWYGDFAIDETKYNKAAAEFIKLQNSITKK